MEKFTYMRRKIPFGESPELVFVSFHLFLSQYWRL